MEQVFYRQPLKTNIIHFDYTTISSSDTKSKDVFHGTIPLYCPECDEIVIDFD